jgi:nitrite reductase (cytochrome c-552)
MHDLTRACVTAVTAGALCGVFGMTFTGLRDAASQGSITDDVDDPAVWGQLYPYHYELYKKSVDMQWTKYGGSEAVPRTPTGTDPRTLVSRSKVDEDIGLRTMWQGYPFAVDFREERGHAYMLDDQTFTMRQQAAPQPGACLNCHASIYVAYKKAGEGNIMRGFEKINSMPFGEARKLVPASGGLYRLS